MKPIKLNICGWGSYSEEVTIDFTKFYRENLFLITGATGAGKTTIFDAVCFALYGDVSGKTREKSSVRSDFAVSGMDTYVILYFSHRGENYTIKRSPRYMRPKKRGDGFTVSSEAAELYVEKEPPITDIAGVNLKVVQLLGMNYEQFKQTSMIAQGEFLELLVASSKDKVEIFRNLFKTEKYDKLQQILTEKTKKLSAQMEDLKSRMEEAVHGIDKGEHKELGELLDEEYYNYSKIGMKTEEWIKEEEGDIRESINVTTQLEQSIKKSIALITESEHNNKILLELKEMDEKWNELLQKKTQIEELITERNSASAAFFVENEEKRYLYAKSNSQKLINQGEEYDKKIKAAEPELIKWKSKMDLLHDIQNKTESLQVEIQKLESFLPMLQELEEEKKELIVVEQKIAKQEKHKQMTLEKEANLLQKEERLKNELQSYQELEKEMAQTQVIIERSILDQEKAEKAFVEYENYINIQKELNQCQKVYLKEEKERDKIRECNHQKEAAYRNAAVGLAARFVRENEPCPVCGSLEHPKIAKIEAEVPDERELEEIKKKLEKKENQCNIAYEKTVEKKAEKDSIERGLLALLKQLEIEGELQKEETRLLIAEKKVQKDREVEKLKFAEENQKEKMKEKESLQKKIKETELSGKEIQKEKEKEIEAIHLLTEKSAVIKGAIKQLEIKLPQQLLKGEEDGNEKLESLYRELSDEKKKIETIRENYEKAKANLDNWKIRLEKNQEDLKLSVEEEENRKNIYSKVRLENCFISEEQYKMALKSKEETDEMNEKIKEYESLCQSILATKKNLEIKAEGKSFVNIEKLHQELSLLEKNREIELEKKEKMAARIERNKQMLKSIQEKGREMEELEKKYGILKDLDNAAKGNNKERVVFEHYVLSSYFEDILHSSNQHLSIMTGGRYELMKIEKVADARTKDSLDIEVLDHYTGKKRSVKSLSGGESFKAALSLALGLSDTVQRSAGGVQIDTLFLDEGFGSLDSESLEQAMDTITSLTEHNRLIGIISHVNELKERFDNQIIVEKGTKGSTLRQIFL